MPGEEWTRHGGAVLSGAAQPEFDLGAWPPTGAEPVELDGFYARTATAGFGYGPAFRGLRAAWRRGEEVFAEVETDPAQASGEGFVAHPALLDAALHGVGLLPGAPDGGARLPFSWSGVTAYATGAASLRVRLAPAGSDALSVHAVDALGAPVLSVDELAFRPVSPGRPGGARRAGRTAPGGVAGTAGTGRRCRYVRVARRGCRGGPAGVRRRADAETGDGERRTATGGAETPGTDGRCTATWPSWTPRSPGA